MIKHVAIWKTKIMRIGKKTRILIMAVVAYVIGKQHKDFDRNYIESTADGFIDFWNNIK